MQVLNHNKEKTIGTVLIEDPNKLIPIGYFDMYLLKEWADNSLKLFGNDPPVLSISYRISDDKCCAALYATDDDGTIYSMLAGASDDAKRKDNEKAK